MKNRSDVFSGLLLLCLCALGAYSVSQIPAQDAAVEQIGSGSFPTIILTILTVFSGILTLQGFLKNPPKSYWPETAVLKKVFTFAGLLYLYMYSFVVFGNYMKYVQNPILTSGVSFIVTTFTFLLIALPLLGRTRPLEIFLVALITTAVLYGTFGWFFNVILP